MSRAETPEQLISAARLFSVGHSNHSMDRFLNLLRAGGVTAVADVRSRPYSGRCPQFNRPELEAALREADLWYAFLGHELGGRPGSMRLYDSDGRVDYERVRRTAAFQQGVDRLIRGCDQQRIVMMCSEEDPLECHRGLMIAPELVERGLAPLHLRGDGSVETTQQLEQRLIEETGVGMGILDGLFAATLSKADRHDVLASAYRAMSKRKAFRISPEKSGESADDAPG
jgi:uncharacterized protein (DUF488 family)